MTMTANVPITISDDDASRWLEILEEALAAADERAGGDA
jgi:hypothetical protein